MAGMYPGEMSQKPKLSHDDNISALKGKMFEELSRLNNEACMHIDLLVGKYDSPVEGVETRWGRLFNNLIKAHEDFIDNMRLIDIREQRIQAQSRVNEFDQKELEIRKRIDARHPEQGADRPMTEAEYRSRGGLDTGL